MPTQKKTRMFRTSSTPPSPRAGLYRPEEAHDEEAEHSHGAAAHGLHTHFGYVAMGCPWRRAAEGSRMHRLSRRRHAHWPPRATTTGGALPMGAWARSGRTVRQIALAWAGLCDPASGQGAAEGSRIRPSPGAGPHGRKNAMNRASTYRCIALDGKKGP